MEVLASGTIEQEEWIERVLGVKPTLSENEDVASPIAIWINAKDEIDHGLGMLAQELHRYGDARCDRVAEFGLYAITEDGETVGMTRALLEFDRAHGARREAVTKALRAAVAQYRSSAVTNPVIRLLDDNPFGVRLNLQNTLNAALVDKI